MRKGFSVPTYIAAVLLALGLVLPLMFAAIANAWEKQSRGTPLLGMVLMMAILGASAAYFVGIATYGHSRFGGDPVTNYYFYWIAGVIIIIVAFCWMMETYFPGNST